MATAALEVSSCAELARLGCTGDVDSLGRLQHDGGTCPVHEDETIAALAVSSPWPVIVGEDVSDKYILRQHAGEGTLGPAKIDLSSTAGLGGFSLVVGVELPDKPHRYIEYSLSEHVQAIAQAVIDGA